MDFLKQFLSIFILGVFLSSCSHVSGARAVPQLMPQIQGEVKTLHKHIEMKRRNGTVERQLSILRGLFLELIESPFRRYTNDAASWRAWCEKMIDLLDRIRTAWEADQTQQVQALLSELDQLKKMAHADYGILDR